MWVLKWLNGLKMFSKSDLKSMQRNGFVLAGEGLCCVDCGVPAQLWKWGARLIKFEKLMKMFFMLNCRGFICVCALCLQPAA